MEKDIGRIKKNDTTDIIIRIDDFGGKPGLTIREYVTSERYTGFTKAGTRISAEKFEEFKKMISSIKQADFPAPSAQPASQPAKEQKAKPEAPAEAGEEAIEDY